jgi:hypothetical protein
VASARAKTHIF